MKRYSVTIPGPRSKAELEKFRAALAAFPYFCDQLQREVLDSRPADYEPETIEGVLSRSLFGDK